MSREMIPGVPSAPPTPMTPPMRIRIYDKDFHPLGEIGNPTFVNGVLRYNRKNSATVGVPINHRLVPVLIDAFAAGGRIVILDRDGEQLISGYMNNISGTGPSRSGELRVTVEGDLVELDDMLAWMNPASAIGSQTSMYWTMTAPAETVLKTLVTANATRLGKPLTCAPDLGRGATITAKFRMDPLSQLFPVIDGAGLDAAGIGVTIKQIDDVGLELDVFEPQEFPRELSEAGGMVTNWTWSTTTMLATDVVVAGQGEGTARAFVNVVDTARRTQFGRIRERWRDARDLADPGELPARGQQTLDEGRPKSGITVTFKQTPSFTVGKHVKLGDRLKVNIAEGAGAPQISDILTEIAFSWTNDDQWAMVPKVGDRQDDSDTMLQRAVIHLARAFGRTQRR